MPGWTVSTEPTKATGLKATIDAIDVEGDADVQQQVGVAKDAASLMIENGAVGAISDEDPRQFAIELAGNTTPGMEVVDDQPGPDVTIRVRQVAPVPEPEPVPEVEDPAEEEAAGEED